MKREVIDYFPPPTIKSFLRHYTPGELFYDWIIGPYGSGKTTGLFFKLVRMAKLQQPWKDGIRRSRAVVVRNTAPQLNDTTLKSWDYWFKDGVAGEWQATNKTFVLRFDDVECEVLFRALDTPADIARVLSLEITFALLDEFVQIPRPIVDALSGRLGRYPSKKDGGATNWGMWGASNTDTEDNWWHDYLNNECRHHGDPKAGNLESNAVYYKQPSGLSPEAENVENLPANYYSDLIKNKSQDWIHQFVDAEWGYSIAGRPVVTSFKPDLHIAKTPLRFNKHLKLVIGLDPGINGTALSFGQEDLYGRLLILGELCATQMGIERFMRDLMVPYITQRFPDADIVVAPDPSANNRSQTNERTVVSYLRTKFAISTEENNRLPLRLNAIDHFTTRLTPAGPALLVDPNECPQTIRALKGGWRYALDPKNDVVRGLEPEKNPWSHIGDAVGYLARYFHRQGEKEARYTGKNTKAFTPPKSFGGSYHVR